MNILFLGLLSIAFKSMLQTVFLPFAGVCFPWLDLKGFLVSSVTWELLNLISS